MDLKEKQEKYRRMEHAFALYYEKGLSNKEIASILGCSERSVIRWKNEKKSPDLQGSHNARWRAFWENWMLPKTVCG